MKTLKHKNRKIKKTNKRTMITIIIINNVIRH